MSEKETVQNAIETALSSPKVSSVIAALTGSSGAAALFTSLNSFLGAVSLGIGCLVGLYTIRILSIKGKILERMERDGESLKE
jgi:hypothetical protein